jgi:hypothetical protein
VARDSGWNPAAAGPEVREHLRVFLSAFAERTERRLARFHRSVNLVTYEGTPLDRLVLHFVQSCWRPEEYRLICSVRPCMDPSLIAEIREFAARRGCPLVDFQGDCPARHPWENAPRSCENVTRHIYDHLQGTAGLLVSSALLNSETGTGFQQTNELYSGLYEFDTPELARYRHPSADRNWNTLFLFEGCHPQDVLPAFFHFVAEDLEPHHIPVCYLDCYNEQEQRKLIELVKNRKEEILGALRGESGGLFAAPAGPS